jgi:hypothetical protein
LIEVPLEIRVYAEPGISIPLLRYLLGRLDRTRLLQRY